MLSELGACVGYLAQAQYWAAVLDAVLEGELDWSDKTVRTAVDCLTHHIPLVREKLIALMGKEYDCIQEARR